MVCALFGCNEKQEAWERLHLDEYYYRLLLDGGAWRGALPFFDPTANFGNNSRLPFPSPSLSHTRASTMSLSLQAGGSATRALSSTGPSAATSHTTSPITTGTSVLAIKYRSGVLLAADTLVSYGSMAKYKNARRLLPINSSTLIGGSGEYSDLQSVTELLKRNALEDRCTADSLYNEESNEECAKEVWSYLRAVMYNRRSKMNPLWNDLVVAGFKKNDDGTISDEPFLGLVDKIGTAYEDDILATGFGSYIALPLMREKYRPDMEEGEARALLEDCLRILFYRDCRALNRVQIAKVTRDGKCLVSEPYELDTYWDFKGFVNSKAGLGTDGGW
jgi:20S proteasome subunit beta 7